ncbi:hypothetical protein [Desulfuromusa kysingii]|uniref:hypothetical protein n=1 Tax=Desulfuromusa kysingii TaxID=37625 RepID=UPI001586FF46|nr:hypothetical protein [Desulfuromusa kysingii]
MAKVKVLWLVTIVVLAAPENYGQHEVVDAYIAPCYFTWIDLQLKSRTDDENSGEAL